MATEPWTTLKSSITHRWHTLALRGDEVLLPNGQKITYSYIEHPGSVVMIPLLSNGSVIVTEQYRYPIQSYSIEFPAGGIDNNEDASQAAERELNEEIGYKAGKLTCLGSFYPSNSGSNEKAFVFLAEDLSPIEHVVNRDEISDILCRKIPFSLVVEHIISGKITDGFTIVASFFLQNYLITHKKP